MEALPFLQQYIEASSEEVRWESLGRSGRSDRLAISGLEWHGFDWRHDIVLVHPEGRPRRAAAILYVTGGEPNPLDIAEAETLADLSGLPVALLFQIPNQPLFDLTEDDLIAHTFVQFLETGDPSWPLLLPMVRSAVRAMEALQSFMPRLERFVVTGGSKRGWTAWLTAATGDPRVAGIAPMVFDNLNMPAQLEHQMQTWGAYSEMIEPYIDLGLQNAVRTPDGAKLLSLVDPFSYLDQLQVPKLIVNGANDPYWTVDALSLYWDELQGSKWASIVPNAGHLLGDKSQALQAIATFSKAVVSGRTLPYVNCSCEDGVLNVTSDGSPEVVRLWVAQSEDLRFVDSAWSVSLMVGHGGRKGEFATSLKLPKVSRNLAAFAELEFAGSQPIRLCTPARVIVKR